MFRCDQMVMVVRRNDGEKRLACRAVHQGWWFRQPYRRFWGGFWGGRFCKNVLPSNYFLPYAAKVYCVPAVLSTNSAGIALPNAVIASNPVQWVGTMWSGFSSLMPSTVA